MILTFVSNYINHHQIPLSNELYKKLGSNYTFIQTEPMEEERVQMGWGAEMADIPYLKLYYDNPEECKRLIDESDIVIFGGVEDESYIKGRLNEGKIVIRYCERLYKEGQWKSISPRGRRKKYEDHTQYANAPVYLLCSGAYVASDFNIVKAYPGKKYTWGYFPEIKEYDLNELLAKKEHDKVKLLWAGRMIDWKHPEHAIMAAAYLKKNNIPFVLDMVGGGPLEEELKCLAKKHNVENEVIFHGFEPPHVVRGYMEAAQIYLFTSDYMEGWGAVLNESMNSACAVVAAHGIGAVPYLIQDGHNGFVYKNKKVSELCGKVLKLAKDEQLRKTMGSNAYETMISTWNPKEAAARLYDFFEGLLVGEMRIQKDDGPMSIAPDISPRNGYKHSKRADLLT